MGMRALDFFVYGIIIVGIGILVRPNSQGPAFVKAVGDSLSGFVGAVSQSGG